MICFTTLLIMSQTKTVSACSLFRHRLWNKHPLKSGESNTSMGSPPENVRYQNTAEHPKGSFFLLGGSGWVPPLTQYWCGRLSLTGWLIHPPHPRPHRLQGSWSWFIGVPVCSRPPSPQKLMTAHNYAAAPEIYWRRFANRSWNAHEQNAQMVQELESPAGDRWEFGLMKKNDINGDPERLVYRCNETK